MFKYLLPISVFIVCLLALPRPSLAICAGAKWRHERIDHFELIFEGRLISKEEYHNREDWSKRPESFGRFNGKSVFRPTRIYKGSIAGDSEIYYRARPDDGPYVSPGFKFPEDGLDYIVAVSMDSKTGKYVFWACEENLISVDNIHSHKGWRETYEILNSERYWELRKILELD